MSEIEKLTTLIGEFVMAEIDDTKKVEYAKDKDELASFTITMKNDQQYTLAISKIA
ncbi:MAG: hypothetical protein FWE03_03245 [Firmicutes bacterium]|nr:hypothetical protein [Bacillota bacterium]